MNPALIARLQSFNAKMNQLEAMTESYCNQSDRLEREVDELKQIVGKRAERLDDMWKLLANSLEESDED